QQIVHGSSSNSLAVGLVMINAATSFFSPTRNKHLTYDASLPRDVSSHSQPSDAARTVARVQTLPRRVGGAGAGFDALGILLVDCPNLGGTVEIVTEAPAPVPGSAFYYDSMIHRMASEYASRFSGL
ncbi:MAG: hypothetical protein ACYC2Z_12130, partial [Candidatus Nanopelagicales bacterium]